jgi:hypothetical protein
LPELFCLASVSSPSAGDRCVLHLPFRRRIFARAHLADRSAAHCGVDRRLATGACEVARIGDLGGERLLPELEDDPLPRIC